MEGVYRSDSRAELPDRVETIPSVVLAKAKVKRINFSCFVEITFSFHSTLFHSFLQHLPLFFLKCQHTDLLMLFIVPSSRHRFSVKLKFTNVMQKVIREQR